MTAPEHEPAPVVPDHLIADALEIAIGIAAAGAKLRPPLAFPTQLRPLLRLQKLPPKALAVARAALEADAGFRARIGSVVSADLVGEAGLLWLQRSDGWRERLLELADASVAADDLSLAAQLRRAEKRRLAAEQAAATALAEVARLRQDAPGPQPTAASRTGSGSDVRHEEVAELRRELTRLQTELRHAGDRLRAAAERAERARAEVAEVRELLAEAGRVRDEVLAERASGGSGGAEAEAHRPLAGAAWLAGSIAEQAGRADGLADALRRLADDVAGLEPVERRPAAPVAPTAPRRARSTRRPAALPGGLYGSSREAAEHLVRLPGVVVLVDGYNVAKLGWPSLGLEQQRDRCILSAEDLARRFGTDIRIVFDGAEVGAVPSGRRVVRVSFSAAGTSADDDLRAAVASLPDRVPVVVVTDDRAVLVDVRARGANTLGSRQWLELTGHIVAGR